MLAMTPRLAKRGDVARREVLRVLDAEAPVARAVVREQPRSIDVQQLWFARSPIAWTTTCRPAASAPAIQSLQVVERS